MSFFLSSTNQVLGCLPQSEVFLLLKRKRYPIGVTVIGLPLCYINLSLLAFRLWASIDCAITELLASFSTLQKFQSTILNKLNKNNVKNKDHSRTQRFTLGKPNEGENPSKKSSSLLMNKLAGTVQNSQEREDSQRTFACVASRSEE